MNRKLDLKYAESIIRLVHSEEQQHHATKCIQSVINRLWQRIDRSEHALKHVLTMQLEIQENIVKLNEWLTPKETAKCPIQD